MDENVKRYQELDRSLTNHSPDPGQVADIELIRKYGKLLGETIINRSQNSRERALALTALEEAVMWAVKGMVLNG